MPIHVHGRPTQILTVALASVAALLGCKEETALPGAPDAESAPALAAVAVAPAFRSISAGWDHTCGIIAGPRAYCWGRNGGGQLGTGDRLDRLTPTPVTGARPFDAVDAGYEISCALTTGHATYCWGQNFPGGPFGQPALADTSHRFVQITDGAVHVCGLTAGGQAWCRGRNGSGQLGDGTTTDRRAFAKVLGGYTFRQISTSNYHTCAVTIDDRAYCWGDNAFGQSGSGGTSFTPLVRPKAVLGGLRLRAISAGEGFTCGVTTTNRAYCWGSNVHGQLGDESLTNRATPALVHGGKSWRAIEAGNSHACGIDTTGKAFCWGRGAEGQLGVGVFDLIDHAQKPRAVLGGLVWLQLSPGGLHTCGVTPTQVAYCWGYNRRGQLGDGTTTSRSKPTKVVGSS